MTYNVLRGWQKGCIFAGRKRKENKNMRTSVYTNYSRMIVFVPKGEVRRFRTFAKTIGAEIQKKTSMDRAIEDIEAGRVNTYASVDDLLKAVM